MEKVITQWSNFMEGIISTDSTSSCRISPTNQKFSPRWTIGDFRRHVKRLSDGSLIRYKSTRSWYKQISFKYLTESFFLFIPAFLSKSGVDQKWHPNLLPLQLKSLTYQKPSSFCMDLKNSLCSAYLCVERKCRLEEKIWKRFVCLNALGSGT